MQQEIQEIVIEGIPFSGKTSLITILKEKISKPIKENGLFKQIHINHWETWDKKQLNTITTIVIVLEANPSTLILRSQSSFSLTEGDLFRARYLYRQLCCFYGNCYLIDTSSLSIDKIGEIVLEIISNHNKSKEYIVPSVDMITSEEYASLPIIIEGESKVVKQYNRHFQVIQYKATVHSHKQQRSGIVNGTDKERMRMTKNILDIFSRHSINHSYFYIGHNYILNESLNPDIDLPPVEVIVKKCFIGTDTLRYYNIENLTNRFGKPVVKKECQNEYQNLIVRFDFRNPNYHPETKQPMGDMVLCDDLADEFINTTIAKKTAKHIFQVLDHHFSLNHLYFEDVCFMLTVEGDKMYGEVSQDCGRYKYTKDNTLTDLDKDVWRRGGSFEMVLEKYKLISDIIAKYVISLYKV